MNDRLRLATAVSRVSIAWFIHLGVLGVLAVNFQGPLFPFNRAWRFRTYVINNPIDSANLRNDSR
jgi:hypothetical protein